jgi:hypothetical protein
VSFLLEVEGLDELRQQWRTIEPRVGSAFSKAYRQVAKAAEPEARRNLASIGAPSADMRNLDKGIKATARETYAALNVRSTPDRPTIAAVLGANIQTVFGRKYPMEVLKKRPWLPWLGAGWQPEDLYGIGPALMSKTLDEVVDIFWEAFSEALGTFGEVS